MCTALENKQNIFFNFENLQLKAKVLLTNLNHPWSVAFLPDNNILITERPGKLKLIDKDFKVRNILGLPPIKARGQGGLFDIVLHPNFNKNKYIYFSYNGIEDRLWGTELARAKIKNYKLQNLEILFKLTPKTRSNRHFGGRILFDNNNYIFLTTGDRGNRKRAQDLNDHAGKVIRIFDNGRVPLSNPFFNHVNSKKEIYSYGHRNIQGAVYNPIDNSIWTHEHGPQGGDELNLIFKGGNFGWPIITYGVNYITRTKIGEGTQKLGMEQPIHKWVPSIATSGMTFITGNHFSEWKNNLLVGSLKNNALVMLELKSRKVIKEKIIFKNLFGRIRDVKIGPDGLIYLLTDENPGKLVQISKN